MLYYAPPLARLIEELERLPTIGPKSAQRLALYLVQAPSEQVRHLAEALLEVTEKIRTCSLCFNFSVEELCPVCQEERRDWTTICVVADSRDLMAIENTGEYRGVYHVLQGLLSPAEGIGPEDIRIRELVERVKNNTVREVILATNPVVEGDATALYIAKLLKPLGVKTTRLALGLPVGGDLDYADRVTIVRALEGRREI
ncbi:MAG TPA: recombination protein RecR [Armatimonadetes bacterium]|nr:recombination protein RecR [Armatimonadota bacterium]